MAGTMRSIAAGLGKRGTDENARRVAGAFENAVTDVDHVAVEFEWVVGGVFNEVRVPVEDADDLNVVA